MSENRNASAQAVGFDDVLLGMLYRRERTNRGFSNVDNFLEAMEGKTGKTMSKDTYYRFEKGTARISVGDLMAINITLFGSMNSPEFWRMVSTSAPKPWNDIENATNWEIQQSVIDQM